ncbi:MAG: ABC transporter ATP-binding protein [Nitrososphaerota archaeon]|nr:energy-coupling factor ABC transporter ATP-binding protein [Nitrososphaerales archaeon]MDW8044530.1 ABC transporter ATP-binding protein [Nitrososphaerota archaeon]
MITFESVTYTYPSGVTALKDINIQIKDGELIAIVGENGAGKTTLIRHINGLLKPSVGRVLVDGLDTRKVSVAELSRKVGIVFQNPDHQLFSESVEDEIKFGLRNFGFTEDVIKRRVEWALKFFDLEDYRRSSPFILSGGEKKRLCLAVVLAWDPKVLILDEPTVGQDFIQKERLGQIIKMLLTQNKTVIIVSHDIEFIWPLQPRMIIMSKGRIIADSLSEEVFHNNSLIKEAHLIKPQLVELYERLRVRPEKPFPNVYEARAWFINNLRGLRGR